jgi:hypothetical protein
MAVLISNISVHGNGQDFSIRFAGRKEIIFHVISFFGEEGYLATISVSISDGTITNDELEGNGCDLIEVLTQHLPGLTEESYEEPDTIACVAAKIQTKHLPYTILGSYLLTILFRHFIFI